MLLDIEREMVSGHFIGAATVMASMGTPAAIEISKGFLESAMKADSPWSAVKRDRRSREEEMLDMYNKLVKDRGKRNG